MLKILARNWRKKCREITSRKISLFGKMQGGRSPSSELIQLDMYGIFGRIHNAVFP